MVLSEIAKRLGQRLCGSFPVLRVEVVGFELQQARLQLLGDGA
jgi:hypothetical protein